MDALKRTTLQMIDLSEQGEHPYVVFPPEAKTGILIDEFSVFANGFYGSIGGKHVICLPADSAWSVYSTKLFRAMTHEEDMRQEAADRKQQKELVKELFPEEVEKMKAMFEAMSPKLELPDTPGQYL